MMSKEENPVVTVEEIAISNMYEIQAVIKLLVKKGLLTEEEIVQEIRELQKEQIEKREKIAKA